jgi:hypothetical protein
LKRFGGWQVCIVPTLIDCTGAAAELTKEAPSRELAALKLGKVLIRRYEAVYVRLFADMPRKK